MIDGAADQVGGGGDCPRHQHHHHAEQFLGVDFLADFVRRDREADQILAGALAASPLHEVGNVGRARGDEFLGAVSSAHPQAANNFVIRRGNIEQMSEDSDRQFNAHIAYDIDLGAPLAGADDIRAKRAKMRLHLIHSAHRKGRRGDAAQTAVDRGIDEVHHRNAVKSVEVFGARQARVHAREALMIAQDGLSVVVARNHRPLDTAPLTKIGGPASSDLK